MLHLLVCAAYSAAGIGLFLGAVFAMGSLVELAFDQPWIALAVVFCVATAITYCSTAYPAGKDIQISANFRHIITIPDFGNITSGHDNIKLTPVPGETQVSGTMLLVI